MARSRRVFEALERLAEAESRAFGQSFLAPVVAGHPVEVRIEGIVCRLCVDPPDFQGWGVFTPIAPTRAVLDREATFTERRRYLQLLPRLSVVLLERSERRWLSIPAHSGDRRFSIEGTVDVHLVEDADRFDAARVAFDGVRAWFIEPDPRIDPSAASFLRDALAAMIPASELQRSGLSAEQRRAYAMVEGPRRRWLEEALRDRNEDRLRDALAHAGATFQAYVERDDGYRVTYLVDGHRHVSIVARDDLSVQTAGICLNGLDGQFDLQCLVGVIRQGRRDDQLVPVLPENQGMPADVYRQVHPPSE